VAVFADKDTHFAQAQDAQESCWHRKHPEVWCGEEILDWIYYVADLSNMDLKNLKGEQFQGLTGKQVCSMTHDDFVVRDPENGALIFNCLQQLLDKSGLYICDTNIDSE